jgi:hypothetical protein
VVTVPCRRHLEQGWLSMQRPASVRSADGRALSTAKTYSGTEVPANSDANLPNAFEAGNRAAQYELEAHLEGQAKTHGGDSRSTNSQAEPNSTDGNPYEDEFVPGSRRMPMR